MLTLIFTCLMVWIFGKLIWIAFKMTWGITKVLFNLVFLPIILIALVGWLCDVLLMRALSAVSVSLRRQ